ncbi:MAG: hypothetical protein K8H88_07255 [Sandaracinaceae bacterium]|nr:hypothetical protein [Sandaracinaceae bacterium]
MKNPIRKLYDFLDTPLLPWSRPILALLVVPLILSFWVPLWRISMEAPQYPRGLWLDIYSYTIEGGNEGQHLQEINTLNHYIGMRALRVEDFADLDWLPFALGVLVMLTLRVAAIGHVSSLVDLSVVVGYVLAFAGARFVYTLYVYGHDLDPEAPVEVEPFTPVILGTKQIANFTTHSMPSAGTYLIGVFFLGLVGVLVYHLIVGRRRALRAEKQAAAATP